MKHVVFVVGILLLPVSFAYGEESSSSVNAVLHDTQGNEVGSAVLTGDVGGVHIALEVHGLPAGVHAFHIHSAGKCEGPDFATAGGHFNPYGKKHGMKNPEGSHVGDLQNLFVGTDGTAKGEWLAVGVTLGEGEHSLFHPEGTSLVIHASPDDEVTDPAGNAGARIACGVITQ